MIQMNWFKMSFAEYVKELFSKLEYNADAEYKQQNTVYAYSEDDILNHIDYFIGCYNKRISSSVALELFFEEFKVIDDVDKNLIYIVTYSVSSGNDIKFVTECAYRSLVEASAYVKECEDKQEKCKELAIKNFDEKRPDDPWAFNNLYKKFEKSVLKQHFDNHGLDDLNDKEYDLLCKYTEDSEFKKYMIEVEGYSEEVADATLYYDNPYNDSCDRKYLICSTILKTDEE